MAPRQMSKKMRTARACRQCSLEIIATKVVYIRNDTFGAYISIEVEPRDIHYLPRAYPGAHSKNLLIHTHNSFILPQLSSLYIKRPPLLLLLLLLLHSFSMNIVLVPCLLSMLIYVVCTYMHANKALKLFAILS